MEKKQKYTDKEVAFSAVMLAGALVFGYLLLPEKKPPKEDQAAFEACVAQLKIAAYPAEASIPRVDGMRDSDQYIFHWSPNSGIYLGHRVDAATCFVTRATLKLTSVTVNGKDQIWRKPD